MTKDERQNIGVEKWRQNKGLGGFCYPTGFGKTYIGVNKIIVPFIKKNPNLPIIIVVDSDNLRQEWKSRLKKEINEDYINNYIKVETINYFQLKQVKFQVSLLILDEMSKYFSLDRQNIWNGTWVQYKFLLWLDATPKDRTGRDKEFYKNFPMVDVIEKKEAELNGWISKSKIINYSIQLTDEEKSNYFKYESMIDENFNKLERNFKFLQTCLAGGEIELAIEVQRGVFENKHFILKPFEMCKYIASRNGWNEEIQKRVNLGFPSSYTKEMKEIEKKIIDIWAPEKVMGYAKATMTGIRNRLDIIYTATNKIEAIIDIILNNPEKQIIIFSQRTNICTKIANAINNYFQEDLAVEYHTKIISKPLKIDENGELTLIGNGDFETYKTGKNKGLPKMFGKKVLKEVTLNDIRKGKAKILVTGTALDRGLDLPKVEIGIVIGFTGNKNQSEQRHGRLTRLDEENALKEALFINVYAAGTIEEDNLRQLQGYNHNILYITRYSDLTLRLQEQDDI